MLKILVRKHRSVLVTGGAGFIGSHIVDRLIAYGYEVRVLDNLSTGRLENIRRHLGRKGFHFMKGDLTSPSVLKRALKGVEIVFHEAAIASVPKSIADPVLTNEVNTTGTLRLLETSARHGVRRLIYASSSSIYGEQGRQRIKEDSVPRPLSPYAVSKLAAEKYCLTFDELGKLEAVSLRYFNVYGPRQGYGPYGGVITAFVRRMLRGQPPIIFGDGGQTRDFVSVYDVVNANILAMTVKNVAGEVFNIGTGLRTCISKLADMIIEASGKENLRPIHSPPRPGDVRHSCADIGKASRMLGYQPNVMLGDFVHELVRKNEEETPTKARSSAQK